MNAFNTWDAVPRQPRRMYMNAGPAAIGSAPVTEFPLDSYTPTQLQTAQVPSTRDVNELHGRKKAVMLVKAHSRTPGNPDGDMTIELSWPSNTMHPLGAWCLDISRNNGTPTPLSVDPAEKMEVTYKVPPAFDSRVHMLLATTLHQPGYVIECVCVKTQQVLSMRVVRPEKLAASRKRTGVLLVTDVKLVADSVPDPAKYTKTQRLTRSTKLNQLPTMTL